MCQFGGLFFLNQWAAERKSLSSKGFEARQPPLPFLFLFCAEALSCLIQKAELEGKISELGFGSNGPSVAHLFSADDSILFMGASVEEGNVVKNNLDIYSKASGQKVNFNKSEVYFGKLVSSLDYQQLAGCFDVAVNNHFQKYLGTPCFVGKNKKDIFKSIKDRIWNKLKGWKRSLFSVAGKEVLIKSVIQSIPNYVMSCFKLPKNCLNSIQSLMARFWWGSTEKKKRIHWSKWS
ncbi:uncharacterized protein LOC109834810 [Asparagus officinalis]|uniref:uncharacterized protein LOC109834810 n=1 Tax=Asparagus officinalis TaxID=4686 RepID=UPI00098E3282|nr:uncharacterized protein LOC109834810 [Asparagus officinalis]